MASINLCCIMAEARSLTAGLICNASPHAANISAKTFVHSVAQSAQCTLAKVCGAPGFGCNALSRNELYERVRATGM